MKTKRIKKIAVALGLSFVMLLSSATVCFADAKSIPMNLVVKDKELIFDVPEKLSMEATTGSTDLTIAPLVVTNLAEGNSLFLLEAKYGGDVDPWKLVANSTNFKDMSKNQHKYSLVVDGTDMTAGAKTYTQEILPSSSYTIPVTGKTGVTTETVNDVKVGSLVLTVGLDDPNAPKIISFTIRGVSYQAEEGMTWAEWVESEYNKDELYYINDDKIWEKNASGWLAESIYGDGVATPTTVIIEGQTYYRTKELT